MAALASLFVEFRASTSAFASDMRDISKEVNAFNRDLKPTTDRLKDFGKVATTVGQGMTAAISLPLIGIGAVATKAAADFESSFAGVRKTVNATEAEFAQLSQQFRDMAKAIPISVNELNRIAEAAGQLGVEKENISGFTSVMAQLGVTTNLTSDEAATSLAQLANITKMPEEAFDRLGATIVALGNAGASTEKEIVDFGLRIAGAGAQVGLTEAQILGFGSALASVGINAEAGGTAISKVLIEIASASASGGKKLEQFAAVAGMSATDFKKAFQDDAAGATVSFVEGLGKISKEGGNVFGVLDEMGLSEVRVRDAMLRASGAGDLLRESIKTGTQAWKDNSALTTEATKRYATFDSQLQLFKNQLNDVAITLGAALLPAFRSLLENAKPFIAIIGRIADGFAALPSPVQTFIIALSGIAIAIGPVLWAIGGIATGIAAIAPAITGVVASISGVVAAFGSMGGALAAAVAFLTGPVGIAVAIGAAVVALSYFALKNQEVRDALSAAWMAIKNAVGGVLDALGVLFYAASSVWTSIWSTWGTSIKALFGGIWGTFSGIISAAFNGIKGVLIGALDVLKGAIQVFTGVVTLNWDTFATGVKNIWQGLWDAVKAIIVAPFAAIQNAANALANGVVGAFKGMFSRTVQASTDAGDAIGNLFRPLNEQKESIGAVASIWGEYFDKQKKATVSVKAHTFATEDATDKIKKQKKAVVELTDAQQSLLTDMETITNAVMDWNAELLKEQRMLAAVDRALDKAAENNRIYARSLREWGDMLEGLNQGLKNLPIPAMNAANELLMIKPPKVLLPESDVKKVSEQSKAFAQAWATAIANLNTRIAESLADVIFKGGNFGKKMVDIAKDTAQGMLSAFLSGLISPLTDAFAKLGQKAAGLLTDKVLDKLPSFGTSAAGVASSGAGSVGSVGGGAGGATGAASGAMGAVGAVGAVAGALAGVGVIFQLKRIEGTMNAVEENTRYSQIQLKDTMEQILWPQFNLVNWMAQQASKSVELLDSISWSTMFSYQFLESISQKLGAGSVVPAAVTEPRSVALPDVRTPAQSQTQATTPNITFTYGDIIVNGATGEPVSSLIEKLKRALQANQDGIAAEIIKTFLTQAQGQVARG